MLEKILNIGVDIGSTTTKILAIDKNSEEVVWQSYKRHHAKQLDSVKAGIAKLLDKFPKAKARITFTGSGAKSLAELLGFPFVQEVVANSIALRKSYKSVGTAIELGGQDAKIIFFQEKDGEGCQVKDMRMNGSCAGGTGAFIDEVASILEIPVEDYEEMAQKGQSLYDISGRCGVYAKTDIQPLLNQGIRKEDIALSAFHAIAKQTIGGLAQGMDINPPVAFVGGPLSFHPSLIQVFKERLELEDQDILIPENPELMVVYGAALSLDSLFDQKMNTKDLSSLEAILKKIQKQDSMPADIQERGQKYFDSAQEYENFKLKHKEANDNYEMPAPGSTLSVFLGIDSGSTTTKFVFLDKDERVVDSFYSSNEGEPLMVAKKALLDLKKKYKDHGVTLEILGVGSTGYGELLFSKAFTTDCHVVETVAHARAAAKYENDVDFILDIGGQDMKAIWMNHGVISNIVVNEACSSGCGSFLENFAATLDIPVDQIADRAFKSDNPAILGSRCTVFMNSSIITEQRNGKMPNDIMAGLCRSIIENVFTKVIRVPNLDSLGQKIMVQGGTFRNDAVLRALEQYLGKEVIRAPYSGLMGAIGVALLAKEKWEEERSASSFIGLDALESFSYTQESEIPCPYCANHCKRMLMHFSTGGTYVTNNRCERGEIIGDIKDEKTKNQLKEFNNKKKNIANLFADRESYLMADYPHELVDNAKDTVIGFPKVLGYWDTMPFWKTFWQSLGFKVKVSPASTRKIYENGLAAVPSDTECFPAKLVHGHIRALEKMGVDYIFMPSITAMPSENTEKTSESMCALVKGSPIVIRNSDNPERRSKAKFESPLFHWHTWEDREYQLCHYMAETFGISEQATKKAIRFGQSAQDQFQTKLKEQGQKVIDKVKAEGSYAIVLASRPYQNDALVNHNLPEMINSFGVDVLTADSIPEINEVDLSQSRIDVVNNYHARALSAAVLAAKRPELEYVQFVSFGCGHDAYLSDEIIRMMGEISEKTPLVLKLDESDVQGPLRIRVRSFIETTNRKHQKEEEKQIQELSEPYEVKFTKQDKKEKIVLVPNTSHAFSQIMTAAMKTDKLRAVALPVGRERAIALGKQYVHNDICFPAQVVIGEILAALEEEQYQGKDIAVGMGKYVGCCRLTHYSALLRKALDEAGHPEVPILTNDDVDYHDMHPGYRMSIPAALNIAFALPMIDAYEEILRKIRPYELKKGQANEAFEMAMEDLTKGIESSGIPGAIRGFKKGIARLREVPYNRRKRKPRVLIVGEYLLNFHPGANHDIEDYLEKNGFEIIEAKMADVIQKTYFYQKAQVDEYHVKRSFGQKSWLTLANKVFDYSHRVTNKIASSHELYENASKMSDLVKESDQIFHHTYDSGEGVLIPAEILHHAKNGCKNFIILQPFGCLPNHVIGRGISKKLKEIHPDIQLLPLDYDPDVSFANIENRLQMLIMNAAKTEENISLKPKKETRWKTYTTNSYPCLN